MSSLKAAKSKPIEIPDSTTGVFKTVLAASTPGVIVGKIVERRPDGSIFVDHPANMGSPLAARTLVEEVPLGASVLLAFEMGIASLPIILGTVYERASRASRTIHMKADRIVLEAKDELFLQCGEGALEARRNGDVHLKGRDVVSRATRTNKVRGATVLIN